MKIVMLTPEDLMLRFSLVAPSIKRALDMGTNESSLEDIHKKLVNGIAQCWVVLEDDEIVATAVTEFIQWSQYRTLHLVTVEGEGWDSYKGFHGELEKFAKDSGCKDIQIWGRKGWERRLRDLNGLNDNKYKHTYSVFSMEV